MLERLVISFSFQDLNKYRSLLSNPASLRQSVSTNIQPAAANPRPGMSGGVIQQVQNEASVRLLPAQVPGQSAQRQNAGQSPQNIAPQQTNAVVQQTNAVAQPPPYIMLQQQMDDGSTRQIVMNMNTGQQQQQLVQPSQQQLQQHQTAQVPPNIVITRPAQPVQQPQHQNLQQQSVQQQNVQQQLQHVQQHAQQQRAHQVQHSPAGSLRMCPFCTVLFDVRSEAFFTHISLFHMPRLNETQRCDVERCNFSFSSRREHMKHIG